MTSNFNPYDEDSWFFGALTREESTDLLMNENEIGSFLLRNSKSIPGDVVLCVREDNKVGHYIVNKVVQNNETRYRIGDQMFPDIPSLLNFYRLHYLDTTPLIKPAKKKIQKVRAKYNFNGKDIDDLPFVKHEVLTVILKNEEDWWTAKNEKGQRGLIPANYVEFINEENDNFPIMIVQASQNNEKFQEKYRTPNIQRKLPALAKVIKARIPNAYDKTALKLQVGDVINVTKLSMNGQWEGELNNKIGHFPFTHIEFIETPSSEINIKSDLSIKQ